MSAFPCDFSRISRKGGVYRYIGIPAYVLFFSVNNFLKYKKITAFGAESIHRTKESVVPGFIHKFCSWHAHLQCCSNMQLMNLSVARVIVDQNSGQNGHKKPTFTVLCQKIRKFFLAKVKFPANSKIFRTDHV